jgi:hypothetical protein
MPLLFFNLSILSKINGIRSLATKVKFTHINRVIHHYHFVDDGEADDRGADDTTHRDDTEGDDNLRLMTAKPMTAERMTPKVMTICD